MTQLGSPATESSPSDGGRQAVRGSRLARRRRVLFWVAGGAALLAIGGLIGSSFVKSPQQIAASDASVLITGDSGTGQPKPGPAAATLGPPEGP